MAKKKNRRSPDAVLRNPGPLLTAGTKAPDSTALHPGYALRYRTVRENEKNLVYFCGLPFRAMLFQDLGIKSKALA